MDISKDHFRYQRTKRSVDQHNDDEEEDVLDDSELKEGQEDDDKSESSSIPRMFTWCFKNAGVLVRLRTKIR